MRISNPIPFLSVIIWLAANFALQSCRSGAGTNIEVFDENYPDYVITLSSDEFEGRAPTTRGGRLTKEFLENEFRRLGVEPAVGDSYRQAVPLVEIEGHNFSDLVIQGQGNEIRLSYLTDMVVGTSLLQEHVELENSGLVFAGYGIVAPEYGWDDYEGLDVKGKTVVVLINDPGYELGDPDLFTGSAMTYYGRWTYKYEEAARQGAQGILIVHETGPASYGWDVVRNSWSGPQYDMVNGQPQTTVEGWIHLDYARQIFQQAGYSFDELKQQALSADFRPIDLAMRASVSFDVRNTKSQSHNIIGYIEGSQYPDETIIYMAHWDHLGKHETDQGVEIYNGAVDNATGTAALLSLAGRFAAMDPPPARSVVFLAVTAEESGLIGSRYYASNPVFDLAKTVGGINIDGMNVYGPTRDIAVVGYQASEMQDYFERHARNQDRVLEPERYPERGYFYRSDHFSLMREGVPMFYPTRGEDYIGRDEDFARQVQQDLDQRYHSPQDVVHGGWDWNGIYQDLWLYYEVGRELANSRHWPQWNQASEFHAIRQETEHLRE